MERIIQNLQKDLRNIIEGEETKTLRKKKKDLVDIRMLRMVILSLQWASVGYQSALRFAGMKFGKGLGEMSSNKEISLVLKEIKILMEKLKEGDIEFNIFSKKKKAEFIIREPSLTNSIPKISQNLCFFKEGFIEGYLEGIISSNGFLLVDFKNVNKISVKETKCIALGDKFCQFTIILK